MQGKEQGSLQGSFHAEQAGAGDGKCPSLPGRRAPLELQLTPFYVVREIWEVLTMVDARPMGSMH